MSVPTLPLAFVGWFFAIVCFAALVLGVLLLQQLLRREQFPAGYPQSRIVGDVVLLLIWSIGLASAFGLLNGYAWGRTGLEYFCWVLIVLVLLSGASRLAELARRAPGDRLAPGAWLGAVAGIMLVALPLIALCAVSIATLRSDQLRPQFEQRLPR
jgi:ribose/xylose/arabinose/galactoside ABC-type transport system permease subunit